MTELIPVLELEPSTPMRRRSTRARTVVARGSRRLGCVLARKSGGLGHRGLDALALGSRLQRASSARRGAIWSRDNRPELRTWRLDWSLQAPDDDWTRRMHAEVARDAAKLLRRAATLSDLSCRQTVCRMYLQFADATDARAFIAAPRSGELDYEYQSLDPENEGTAADRSRFTYEVLVKRDGTDAAAASAAEESPSDTFVATDEICEPAQKQVGPELNADPHHETRQAIERSRIAANLMP